MTAAASGCIDEALTARGRAVLALAGGRTPFPAYLRLAERPLDWSRVTLLPTDERWVPRGHPAIGLITQAPFTAAEIATAVLHGIEAGDAVIVPDDIAVSMIAMKRTDPEAYAVWGRDGAARLARRELGG